MRIRIENISQEIDFNSDVFSHDRHELSRVLWHKARDLTGQAAVRQEEEGGDVEEEGAADDAGHGRKVKRIVRIKLFAVVYFVITIIIQEHT